MSNALAVIEPPVPAIVHAEMEAARSFALDRHQHIHVMLPHSLLVVCTRRRRMRKIALDDVTITDDDACLHYDRLV